MILVILQLQERMIKMSKIPVLKGLERTEEEADS
jgi:hypothetical protein